MTTFAQKYISGALAALMLAGSVIAISSPAQAQHRRYYDYGAGPFIAGAIGGLAIGSIIAGSRYPAYYDEPVYGHCWYQRERVYDDYGYYIGIRRVRVCE